MAGKTARSPRSWRSWNEEQLDFPFLAETEASAGAVAESNGATSLHSARTAGKARGLANPIANARAALLGAPIEEVSAHLLPLLEFCEAALTRALDTVTLRGAAGKLFSPEEYRSLRGIGQAQWLLAERYGDQESEPKVTKTRKGKKSRTEKM